jgi:hypothetical protein
LTPGTAGADWAEQFRVAYEARAGRRVDPWWDLYALASYNDSWTRFIPVQVNGRAQVDVAGMTGRVEALLQATLRRLLELGGRRDDPLGHQVERRQ